MNRHLFVLILLFGMPSVCVCQNSDSRGGVTIKISGFRDDKGQTCISLFNNSKGYPGKYEKAYKIMRNPIKDKQVIITFTNVPYGTYAISVLHDENSNNKMETTFIGIPKEGCGASNNPRPIIGPPSFSDAKFELNSDKKIIEISMQYF